MNDDKRAAFEAWAHPKGFELRRWPPKHNEYRNDHARSAYLGWQAREPELDALRSECARMLSDQDYEYNRKTNDLIERHAKRVAKLRERIKVLETVAGDEYVAEHASGYTPPEGVNDDPAPGS